MRISLAAGLMSAVALLSGCVQGGGAYQQPTRIDTGRIISVQQVTNNGGWGAGAAIGGAAGVLTGGGHSTESKLIRGALGALAGAAVQKGLTTGGQDTYVTVQTRYGQAYNVKHSSRDLVPGDCVQVETRYNGDIRLYRTSNTQCNF
ncbi:hypothetical protein P5704_026395 (plasmid) [Pseudomonas sp. FeN3W]|nr:hypothetical protein P5704_026395 [Pseudomonas sp. FeN3W]